MATIGKVTRARRVDVAIRDDSVERHVLFLYSGVVSLFFASGSGHVVNDNLNFVVPDSNFQEFGVKIPPIASIGLTVTPTNFNTNPLNSTVSVIAVTNPELSFDLGESGTNNIKVSADIAVGSGILFEVQYQFAVDAFLPPRS